MEKNKLKLLFVDDEPHILQGLQRMLRPMRDEWEMAFCGSGADALGSMEKTPADVIISDMRMPEMNGAELLTEIKQNYPRTIRIILSGHSDHEMIINAVLPAHQYLSKPCDHTRLKEVITRIKSLNNILEDDALQTVVGKIDSLPTIPAVYQNMLLELDRENVSLKKVGTAVGQDAAMSAKILQLVNSSFFGVPKHVAHPEQAVTMLGLDIIRGLILTEHIFDHYSIDVGSGINSKDFSRHNLAAASYARSVAEEQKLSPKDRDYAFIGGLLHDIGLLVFSREMSSTFLEVTEKSRNEDKPLWMVEYELLGTSHAEIGAYLLGIWGFPTPILEGVAYHHNPAKCAHEQFDVITAIYVGAFIAHQLCPLSSGGSTYKSEDAYLEKMKIKEKIPKWIHQFTSQLKREAHNE